MGWFPCTGRSRGHDRFHRKIDHHDIPRPAEKLNQKAPLGVRERGTNGYKQEEVEKRSESNANENKQAVEKRSVGGNSRKFAFQELAVATNNFRRDCLLGEGGFGKVYKGRFEETNQVVAIKQLNRDGFQGNREFLIEVVILGLLHHPNLVNLVGYCADGDQRLLVYEYMPLGSLEDHLHVNLFEKKPLDWNTRMQIAAAAAKGLEYLHTKADPPVIYRDLKSSNILLGEGYHAKLSDFGLAKLGPVGDSSHVSTRVMGTYGYCAPEYCMTGQLTLKSDIYSFGVVLLELITGRRAVENSKVSGEYRLVEWARPMFKDRKRFRQMADPILRGQYPVRGMYQAIAVAAMCVQEQPSLRPSAGDLVTALAYLANAEATSAQDPSHVASAGTSPLERKHREMQRCASE